MNDIFEKIEKLQKKPAHVRKRILYATTIVCSLLIFLLWLSIFPATLERLEKRGEMETSDEESPVTSLKRSFGELLKSTEGMFDEVKEDAVYIREEASTTIGELKELEEGPVGSPPSAVVEPETIEQE